MKHDEEEEPKEEQEKELPGWVYSLNIFFRKYGSHMLLMFSLLLLGFVAWQKYQQHQLAKEDEAWVQLSEAQTKVRLAAHPEQARGGVIDFGDPAQALRSVGSSSDLPAVRAEAYLMLGQYYLNAINLGHYGKAETVDVSDALKQAEAAYTRVATDFKDQPPFWLNARMGLARIAEDKNNWDDAAAMYAGIKTDANASGFPQMAGIAEDRMSKLPQLRLPIALAPAPSGVSTTQPFPSSGILDPMH